MVVVVSRGVVAVWVCIFLVDQKWGLDDINGFAKAGVGSATPVVYRAINAANRPYSKVEHDAWVALEDDVKGDPRPESHFSLYSHPHGRRIDVDKFVQPWEVLQLRHVSCQNDPPSPSGFLSQSKYMDLLVARAWLASNGSGCTERYEGHTVYGHTVVVVPDEDGNIALVPRSTLQQTDYVQTKTNKENDILVVVHDPFREADMDLPMYWRAMFAEILAAARADAASRVVLASCINGRTRSPVLVMCVLMQRKRGRLFPAEAKKLVNAAMCDRRSKAAKSKQCDYYCDRNGEFTDMLFCMHLYTATNDIRCTYPQRQRALSKFWHVAPPAV